MIYSFPNRGKFLLELSTEVLKAFRDPGGEGESSDRIGPNLKKDGSVHGTVLSMVQMGKAIF